MGKLTVEIKDYEYDVHIGEDAYSLFATAYAPLLDSADRIGIIVDENVAGLHLSLLQDALRKTGRDIVVKTVPAGESCKSPAVYIECQSFLLQHHFTRNSLLIAFGGELAAI